MSGCKRAQDLQIKPLNAPLMLSLHSVSAFCDHIAGGLLLELGPRLLLTFIPLQGGTSNEEPILNKHKSVPGNLRGVALRAAQHEAGHFIVGRVRGFEVRDCTATLLDGRGRISGGSQIIWARSLGSTDAVIHYLETRIEILYAGSLAESLNLLGKVDWELAQESLQHKSGQDDNAQVRELLYILRSLKFSDSGSDTELLEQRTTLGEALWTRAAAVVETEHTVIRAIASHLAEQMMRVPFKTPVRLLAAQIDTLPEIKVRFAT
jgi:hypothetical protein